MTDKSIKFKVREFQWYQVQTKVRNIIHDLVLPVVNRCKQLDNTIQNTRTSIQNCNLRMTNFQYLVHDHPDLSKIPAFIRINKELNNLKNQDNMLRFTIQNSQKVISQHFQRNAGQLSDFNKVLMDIKNVRQQIQQDSHAHQSQLANIIQINKKHNQQALETINDLHSKYNQQQINYQQIIRQLQKKISDLTLQNDKNKAKINQFDKQIKVSKQQMHLMTINIIKLQQNYQTVQQKFALIKKLDFKADRNSIQLDSLKKQFRLCMPLLFMKILGQAFRFCLKRNQIRKLIIFEHKKLQQIDQDNLALSFSQDQNFDFTRIMSQLNRQNHQELYDLKFNKLKQMGIDPTKATASQQQESLAQVLAQKDQPFQKNDGISSDQLKQILYDTKKDIQNIVYKKLTEIQSGVQVNNKSCLSSQQYIQHWLTKLEQKIQIQSQKIKNQVKTVKMIGQKVQTGQSKIRQSISSSNIRIDKNKQNNKMVMQYLLLQSHLQLQDQCDRKSISLMGLAQHFGQTAQQKQQSRLLSFSKQCLSCNGCPSTTLAAFKLACLSYSPSNILIEGQNYPRWQIIQAANRILQGLVKGQQNENQQSIHKNVQKKETFRTRIKTQTATRKRSSSIHIPVKKSFVNNPINLKFNYYKDR